MKHTFAVFGLVGLVGCFLPIALGMSLFDARAFDGWLVFSVMAAFAIPMGLGLADKLQPAASLAATACFGYILYKFGFDVKDLILDGGIGGKAMGICAIAGFVTSIGSLAETRR